MVVERSRPRQHPGHPCPRRSRPTRSACWSSLLLLWSFGRSDGAASARSSAMTVMLGRSRLGWRGRRPAARRRRTRGWSGYEAQRRRVGRAGRQRRVHRRCSSLRWSSTGLNEQPPAEPAGRVAHRQKPERARSGWILPATVTNDGDEAAEAVVLEATGHGRRRARRPARSRSRSCRAEFGMLLLVQRDRRVGEVTVSCLVELRLP